MGDEGRPPQMLMKGKTREDGASGGVGEGMVASVLLSDARIFLRFLVLIRNMPWHPRGHSLASGLSRLRLVLDGHREEEQEEPSDEAGGYFGASRVDGARDRSPQQSIVSRSVCSQVSRVKCQGSKVKGQGSRVGGRDEGPGNEGIRARLRSRGVFGAQDTSPSQAGPGDRQRERIWERI
jgi:hypothetical protein